jgi:hypothetical protein
VRHSYERTTQSRARESVRREVYSSLARAWKSTNVVVGATFLLGSKAPVHRKHRNFIALPAFFSARNLTVEAGKRDHRGRIHGATALILGSTRERAKLLRQAREPSRNGSESLPRCRCIRIDARKTFVLQVLTQNLDLAHAAKQCGNVFRQSFLELVCQELLQLRF